MGGCGVLSNLSQAGAMDIMLKSVDNQGLRPEKTLFIFIDGLGIGVSDPRTNPLACFKPKILVSMSEFLLELPCGGMALRNDPSMGIGGLPQSATGQAALFTGINTAQSVGRHLSGFPTRELRGIVQQHSILKILKKSGRKVAFANTYTEEYLHAIYPDTVPGQEGDSRRIPYFAGPGKKSVTTVMNEAAGLRFRTESDLVNENGLHMDFSNRFLHSRGHEVPLRTPREAAEILVRLAARFDLCVYEFFFTDLIGHRGNLSEALKLLEELDTFLFHVVSLMDFENSSLIITSDHGNIEDMSTGLHTGNLVPLLLWGSIHDEFSGAPDPVPITEIAQRVLNHVGSDR